MLERTSQFDDLLHKCDPVIFDNVCLTIDGNELLHNVSCELGPGGKTVVMGPNGAGKSLFLRLLAGLVEPTSGSITGGVKNLTTNVGSCLSMVFQNPVLLRRSTFANVAYVLKGHGFSRAQIEDKVVAALKNARLEHRAQTPARRLSGGERQRLALARALVVDPGALLLDEVTANLDPASTQIVEMMADEAAQNGTKVVFVTHDVKQAKRVSDDILFIHGGRVITHKPGREFFRNPGSEEAQAYLDGRVVDEI